MRASEWISIASTLATLILAFFAYLQLKESRKAIQVARQSAEATEQSAKATEKSALATENSVKATERSAIATESSAKAMEISIERMKDSQKPFFDVGVGWHNFVTLTIRNVGPGLGIIKLVTVREDIKIESVTRPVDYWPYIHPPFEREKGQAMLNGFVIGSKEEFTFRLEPNESFGSYNINSSFFESLSSLSIFYEDVYSQLYRVRTVYTAESSAPNSIKGVNVIFKENFETNLQPKPANPFEDIRWRYQIEGQRNVIYRGLYKPFYRYKAVEALRGVKLKGTPLTRNADLIFRNITFDWHGYPEFHVQIVSYLPFTIVYYEDKEGQHTNILDDNKGKRANNTDYGLLVDGDEKDLIITLYHQITNEIRAHFNSIV